MKPIMPTCVTNHNFGQLLEKQQTYRYLSSQTRYFCTSISIILFQHFTCLNIFFDILKEQKEENVKIKESHENHRIYTSLLSDLIKTQIHIFNYYTKKKNSLKKDDTFLKTKKYDIW